MYLLNGSECISLLKSANIISTALYFKTLQLRMPTSPITISLLHKILTVNIWPSNGSIYKMVDSVFMYITHHNQCKLILQNKDKQEIEN